MPILRKMWASRLGRFVRQPHGFFVIFAILAQCAYIPHFFVLADDYHGAQRFFHVMHLANTLNGDQETLPVSLLELTKRTAPEKLFHVSSINCVNWAEPLRRNYCFDPLPPNMPVTTHFNELLSIPLQPQKVFPFESSYAGENYSPAGYMPYALAGLVGLWFHVPPVVLVYAMVVFNAEVAIAFGFLTLRVLPALRWQVCFILLMPSSFMFRDFIMVDALTLESCMFILGLTLNLRSNPRTLSQKHQYWMLALAAWLGIVKSAYFLTPLIYALIPSRSFASPHHKRQFVVFAVACSFFVATLWNSYVAHRFYPGVFPDRVYTILSDPISYLLTIYSPIFSATKLNLMATNLMTWNVNWLRDPLMIMLCLLPPVLLTLTEPALPLGGRFSGRERLLAFAIFLLSWGVILTAMYVHKWDSAETMINLDISLQGRYFLPVIPYLLLAMHSIMTIPQRLARILRPLLVLGTVAGLCYMNYYQLH